ncbi:hypothetical protein DFH11DRAFT_636949 [Phellopilus nigrolimitatus]|nr:hypothetical protein DFH11DRAFT_636949 [Phellopilus nigrolimitatus]
MSTTATSFGLARPGARTASTTRRTCASLQTRNELWALSGMTLNALRHTVESLDYLTLLKNQTGFKFCTIPQSMAFATLSLCFMNPAVFQRSVKIRKAEAARLIMCSTKPREVALIFREYARVIHAKSVPADPNFLRISVACRKVHRTVVRTPLPLLRHARDGRRLLPRPDRRAYAHRAARGEGRHADHAAAANRGSARAGREGGAPVEDFSTKDLLLYVGGIFLLILALALFAVWVMIRYFA